MRTPPPQPADPESRIHSDGGKGQEGHTKELAPGGHLGTGGIQSNRGPGARFMKTGVATIGHIPSIAAAESISGCG